MHPAKYFIRYLMTLGVKTAEDNDWIRSALSDLQLFPNVATDEILDAIRAEIHLPKSYRPNSKSHKVTIEFQKALKVRDMHTMTKTCKNACDLRINTAARDVAEALLMSRNPFPQAAKHVNKQCRTWYRADDVAMFHHYFFNVDLLSRVRWIDAIRRRGNYKLLKPAIGGKPETILWKLGEDLVIDSKRALEEAFTHVYMRLVELRGRPADIGTIKMTQMLIDSLVRTQDAMKDSDVRMKEMIKQLENFQQKRQEIEIPSIASLGETSLNLPDNVKERMLPPAKPEDLN